MTIDRCPGCDAPTHASEGDDLGTCANCRARGVKYGPAKRRRRALKNALRRTGKAALRLERRRRKKNERELPEYVDLGGEA